MKIPGYLVENVLRGHKPIKYSYTFLLCGNANIDCKMK